MIANADITIYHKAYDPASRLNVWTHTQYVGVNWYGRQQVTVGDSGLNTADSYIVRIPTSADVQVSNGDVVVKGLVSDKITGSSALTSKYMCFTVTSVGDNRRGSPALRHWRIEGK